MAIPQVGDPFLIPKPDRPYAALAREAAPRCRIGVSLKPLMGVEVEPEVAATVQATANVLADMGHEIVEIDPDFDGLTAVRDFCNIWFFALDSRLEGYARITGHKIGHDSLEPVIHALYEHAKSLRPADFIAAMGAVNAWRRRA